MKIKGGRKLARSKNRGTKYVAQRARTTRNKVRAAQRHVVLYAPNPGLNAAHRQSKLDRQARRAAKLPKPVKPIPPFKRKFPFVITPIWSIFNTNPRPVRNRSAVAARAFFARSEVV